MQAKIVGGQVVITMPMAEAKDLTNDLLWVHTDEGEPLMKLWQALDELPNRTPGGNQ